MLKLLTSITVLIALFLSLSPCRAETQAAPFTEDFTKADRWLPRPGIKVEVITAEGRAGNCLHLQGRQAEGWNYVTTKPLELRPGAKYRLTAWLRVPTGESIHPPYFKVEFVPRKDDAIFKSSRVPSTSYEVLVGGWQQLDVEFECPPGAGGGWIGLEKGVDSPQAIDAFIADVRVEEIPRFTAVRYPFATVPAALVAVKDVHPRLYLSRRGWDELKEKVRQDPYKSLLARVLQIAGQGVKEGPPPYVERGSETDDEQLWQREVGNMMPHLAMAYKLTGEPKYLKAASDFIRASASYKTWGLGDIDGRDLAAGHQLYGMALAYDWLYNDLDAPTRQAARECLERRGRFMFKQLMSEQVWWHRTYLQNHQWVNMTGLATAGLALYGQTPDVDGWIRLPLEKFRIVMKSLGPDGASHEGVPYWSYGLEYMLKFMDLSRTLLGEDLFKDNAWFRNTTSFRVYAMLPRGSWRRHNSLMSFADGPRYDWYGPDYLLHKLAAEYRDGHAQWLADELAQMYLCGDEARFLDLIWFDPSVAPTPPTDLPLLKHFADLGLVCLRSGWGGDESVFAFKCGPSLGHEATRRFAYDPGAGHAHPDAGTFQLFAHGDWLIVDDGYSFKRTAYQNTALINGIGQLGEGKAWLDATSQVTQKSEPTILSARAEKDGALISADVTPAYGPAAGLTRYLRHVRYIRPDCWVVVDEFQAKAPSEFTLSFHADYPFRESTGRWIERGPKGSLAITPLWPRGVIAKSGTQPIEDTGGQAKQSLQLLTLVNPEKRPAEVFVTVLEAYASADEPRVVASLEETPKGTTLLLRWPDHVRRFVLDLKRTDPAAAAIRDAD